MHRVKADCIRTFPNGFTAGAKAFEGISDRSGFQSFFPTVASLPQFTAGPTVAPRQDPHGYFFKLLQTMTPMNSMPYFQSAYPKIAALRTCNATFLTGLGFNPPGLVVETQLAQPTLFTPAEPGRGSRSYSLPTVSSTDTGTVLTMLDSTLASSTTTEKSPLTTSENTVTTHALPSIMTSGKGPPSTSVHSTRTSESLSTPSILASKSINSPGTSQSSPRQHLSLSTSGVPLRNSPTRIASSGVNENSTTTSTVSQESVSVSVISGNVVVDGQTLSTGTTLTLGSGSVLTAVALTTNQVGQTILFGNVTAVRPHSSERPSHSGSNFPIIPSAVPTTTRLSATASSTNPSSGSSNRPELARILRLWAVFWTLRAIVQRGYRES